jgi:phage repressor protein C with HTH and peptisase S24 domain
MKGCYVNFLDQDTERFFRSRIETFPIQYKYEVSKDEKIATLIPYVNSLPLLDLRAAAASKYESIEGYFGEGIEDKLFPIEGGPFPKDRFLVKAEGNSMEPKIHNGSLCLFRKDPGGSRNGKIVLCQISGFAGDAPLAVIKLYKSERTPSTESLGMAKKIILSSLNPSHPPIEITEGDELSILGIFERLI